METNEERVLHALIQLGGVASGQEIAENLGWPNGARRLGQVMRFILPRGRVERIGDRGVYRIKAMEVLIHEAARSRLKPGSTEP